MNLISGSSQSSTRKVFVRSSKGILSWSRWGNVHDEVPLVLIDQAIPLLERDDDNAFSFFRLAYASQKTVKSQLAQARLAAAMAFNQPTPEQAFVVPAVDLDKAEHLTAVRR